ncbi:sugar-phosphate isomerase LacAB/RpiB family [Butyrivibrio proteoclasticus B316]|uniref:Sugar-phosphate isomerase LacAB/RpiB family n=1 Tax=Butyrivibrio proteoclasticus (strain ATCC 51982 / DSM 14932 / B316) TaxID=515622 RepID=E0S2Z6_BUTPB|nr:RpiB/LacA/LacB family sugar-phosphate isomerase [Butyrivibrio proteoclasticus]ADL35778.1 sugar-phosphate isomerase LacAB/RpiB family [Butyrivibrio proteoclasticus B316]
MRIGVIQASSQAAKNQIIYDAVSKYAPKESEVINFGCTMEENENYSYIEISILVGILLASKAVDFIVTGCSSGQGMMLACNSIPGVICGYAPTPKDAYLFAQINNGNAISLPLGEDYTWSGTENLERTIEALFSEPFGQGYPISEAERKIKDTEKLKEIRRIGQVQFEEFINVLDVSLLESIKRKKDVIQNVMVYGKKEIADLIK